MAYKHITSCVALSQRKTLGQVLLAHGVPAAAIAGVIGALIGGGVGAAIGIGAVSPLAFITGYCDWWFHQRLVCIQDDQCAVGTASRIAVSHGLDDPDLDYTINLVLAPVGRFSKLNAQQQVSLLSPEQVRYFQAQKDAAGTAFPPLDGIDTITTLAEGEPGGTTALHCEIEGDGMRFACTAGTVGAVVGTGAGAAAGAVTAAACAATGPFVLLCLLAALIVALIVSAIVTGLGWAAGVALGELAGHPGAAEDVLIDQGFGTIHEGDHLAIFGDWIFDTAHDGWHELHPVKKILKVQCPFGTTVPGVSMVAPTIHLTEEERDKQCAVWLGAIARLLCQRVSEAGRPEVKEQQAQPKNQWVAHPRLG